MARLLTDHDPGHIHALLGSIALLHFLYRTLLVFTFGDAFPAPAADDAHSTRRRLWLDMFLVLVHSLLPMASLLLPLPEKRNFKSPMIWPEFRLHSLVFASRHVLATLFWLVVRHYYQHTTNESRTTRATTEGLFSMSLWQFAAMLLLVQATMFAASTVTNTLGCAENRTTNAMPYDPCVPEVQKVRAKRLYTYAQFQAAALVFASAPLLMTLVRKGKCSASTYHCVYTWSLILPFLILLRISDSTTHDWAQAVVSGGNRNAAVVTGSLALWLRTGPLQLPKHLVWLVAPGTTIVLVRCLPLAVTASYFVVPLCIIFVVGASNLFIPSIMHRPYSNGIALAMFGLHFANELA